jgi:hypothetical protein
MIVNNIKSGIISSLISFQFEDVIDRLITSCLLYEYLDNVLKTDNELQNNIKTLADTYAPNFTRKLREAKETFISYDLMRAKIESFKKTNFLAFSLNEINQINQIYKDKTEIKKFSLNYFSQYMYKLVNISDYHYKKLSINHFKIMAPISRFYKDTYGIPESDLEIFTALGYIDNPGKEIIFRIKGVDPTIVVNDVSSLRIPIKKNDDYYSIKKYGQYVKLLTN